jgi:hypothetical protein
MVSMVDQMVDQNATYLTRRRGVHHNRFLLSAPKPSDWVKTSQLAKKEK